MQSNNLYIDGVGRRGPEIWVAEDANPIVDIEEGIYLEIAALGGAVGTDGDAILPAGADVGCAKRKSDYFSGYLRAAVGNADQVARRLRTRSQEETSKVILLSGPPDIDVSSCDRVRSLLAT